jgi:antitoxin MazE
MKTQIIQIGNSQGVRIPKVLLQESGITGEVELELSQDGILIRNISKPRAHWDAIFRSLQESENDVSLDPVHSADFDTRRWQW